MGQIAPTHRAKFARRREPGFVITLVAVFLLFVVGAMAALSIDVVTLYTARSEAQLAADAGALAGARVIANSGATSYASDPTMLTNAQTLASTIAMQVATSNSVGGPITSGNVNVWFNGQGSSPCPNTQPVSNPCVTVKVTRTDLPVFFARIWGRTQMTISATATAEAYNPSGLATGVTASGALPIAPSCVKPWLLPNMDPTTGNAIFDVASGQILDSTLLGWQPGTGPGILLQARCGGVTNNCGSPTPTVQQWQYFVGDDVNFPPPTQALPSACTLTTNFQVSIAGCMQTPISCGAPPASQVLVDTTYDSTLDTQAGQAVDCMAHLSGNRGDSISPTMVPPQAFQFTVGDDNPLVPAGLGAGSATMVSDSLVTVPVFDSSLGTVSSTNPVTVIGFVQLFLQPVGNAVGITGMRTKVINMAGCGINSNPSNTISPVYGNGATAVPVRLITPP